MGVILGFAHLLGVDCLLDRSLDWTKAMPTAGLEASEVYAWRDARLSEITYRSWTRVWSG